MNFIKKVLLAFKTAFLWMKGIFELVKKFFSGPAEFLSQGRVGSVIALTLTGAFMLYGGMLFHAKCIMPSFVVYFITALLVFAGSEIIYFLFKIIFKTNRRTIIYFLIAFLLMENYSYMGSSSGDKAIQYLLAIFIPVVADVFGRCLWSFFVKRNYRYLPGYIFSAVCVIIIGNVVFLCAYDSFGKSFIPEYKNYENVKTKLSDDEVVKFNEIFEKGIYTVETCDYGTDVIPGIRTNPINLTGLAERNGITGKLMDLYFDYSLEECPVAGKIWMPVECENCPVLFIVHGNHVFYEPSYLGYDYLGEYLASFGYVVVSIDENCLNSLDNENDARAVLILENIKQILYWNSQKYSFIYNKIDSEKIAIAGHSRGGESVATAYLLNSLKRLPDNGYWDLDYNFNISSVIAIAPTVDQYMPGERAVEISDVNYLLLHGSNDQDVTMMEGVKQYENVTYTGNKECFKSAVYIMGANHGQFNSRWGRYDTVGFSKCFYNTSQSLVMDDQQKIAKIFIKAFLDKTLLYKTEFSDIFYDTPKYCDVLPATVYETVYNTSNFKSIVDFEEDCDISYGKENNILITADNFYNWYEQREYWCSGGKENFVLYLEWTEDNEEPSYRIDMPVFSMAEGKLSFKISDARSYFDEDEDKSFEYKLNIYDKDWNKAVVENAGNIIPSMPMQFYKTDLLTKNIKYKNQFATVLLCPQDFNADENFDFNSVVCVEFVFDKMPSGAVHIDSIGIEK